MQNISKKGNKQERGITLIALVITIIVLLILAAVSIATLAGKNGILTQANKAKENTEKATEKENTIVQDYESQIIEEIGVDWEFAFANAQKHTEQKETTIIGLGTDGKPVNMDLWAYSLMEDGTYGLNTKENLSTDASAGVTSGYKGSFTEEGKIIGKVPQYISSDDGETFIEVTDLKWTFYNCSELKIAPTIPDTVTKMNYTFRACTNLTTTSKIPYGVTELSRTFLECKKLEVAPQIPNTVTNMAHTFDTCTSLRVAPKIPNSVTNMIRTFYHCTNLTGIIEINANLTGKIIVNGGVEEKDYVSMLGYAVEGENCKLKVTGACKMLVEIVTETNNPNITL